MSEGNTGDGRSKTGLLTKVAVFLGAISGVLTLLVAIKVSLGQLLPAGALNAANAGLAKAADFVFNVDCDIAGNWQCTKGCSGPASIQKDHSGYRLTNEKNQQAAAISLRARELFAPTWDGAHGGLFGTVTADCKTIDFGNGSSWGRRK